MSSPACPAYLIQGIAMAIRASDACRGRRGQRRPPRHYGEDYIVFVGLPACPRCGNFEALRVNRTSRASDGSVTRFTVCPACGAGFKVVYEPPDPPEGPTDSGGKSVDIPPAGKTVGGVA